MSKILSGFLLLGLFSGVASASVVKKSIYLGVGSLSSDTTSALNNEFLIGEYANSSDLVYSVGINIQRIFNNVFSIGLNSELEYSDTMNQSLGLIAEAEVGAVVLNSYNIHGIVGIKAQSVGEDEISATGMGVGAGITYSITKNYSIEYKHMQYAMEINALDGGGEYDSTKDTVNFRYTY